MKLIDYIFGSGKDLNILQMSGRAVAVFFIALFLIRISGRRSFGIKTPFDNIIAILLGAILSRAVVGDTSFLANIGSCLCIVVVHRLVGRIATASCWFGKLVGGEKILLFKNNKFIRENMKKALVDTEDILQGIRKNALTEKMEDIDTVYMERNGEITVIKKSA